ncbi:uncharacterized protein OCT59_003646 [Rhizophagus irregularis]|nr:hypothetical protein OCT59_003646 [Rhizophagus irregularis]GBC17670.1 hypothetical protein GLOIN_2v1769303 [Rhizophagus irregularis DAOM 181602=DAOM 197198]
MVILNKTLWLLIMILLSLLPIFASEPPIALKTINNHEDLPNLHLDGSDTYNDGTIILLFTQKSTNKIINNTTIHLRIIFNDETIQSIEIDCSSQPDFIPRCKKSKDSDACSLNPKALIEGYVLIESVDKSERKKQIIVSWDKKIVSILELDEYKITVPHNSKQDFSIMELTNNKTLVWKKFTIDQNNASLKREDKTYNVPNDKTIIRNFFDPFSLVEGGYAAIIFMRTKLIHNKEFRNKNSIDEIYVIYFNDILPHQQFLLHSSSSEKSELLSLGLLRGGCVSFFDGSGYTYDFIESFNKIKSDQFLNSGSYNTFRIHFLSNGAVSLININLNITDNDFIATPLFYGGYIGQYSKKNDKSLIVLDNNNNIKNKLHLPFYDNIEHSKLKSFVMQKQLYIWFFNCSDDQTWNINYYSLNLINDYDSRFIYQNPSINGTYPKINETIKISSTSRKQIDFIINYNKPILLFYGNITLYQYLNDDVILRQRVSGRSDHCRLFNETAVSIKIFVSALHQTNVKYGIKVDDDFVKLQSNEEPLLGISERIWTFNISLETPDKPADQVSITSRLKLNKENYKKIDSIEDRKLLIQTLKNELVQAIPIDPKRLEIQEKIQNEYKDNNILFSATIKPTFTNNANERSTDSVLKDLDELIKKKKYNLLSNGNITRFLDTSYGANPLPDFWMTYGYHMIALGLLIVIVGCMIVFANYKYREGNNYSIIKIVIIIVDLVLDIMFIIMGIPEKPHLFVFSLLSVIIPIVFNTMMTTYSLIQEMIHNDDFNNWCKKHGFTISMFTILSSADVEALHILSSKIAGFNAFSAPPLSSRISRIVFWAGCINIFLEDIPQFIIQIYYKRDTIVYTIIPTLSLISSSVTLCISFFGKLYFFFMYFYGNKKSNRSQKLIEVI